MKKLLGGIIIAVLFTGCAARTLQQRVGAYPMAGQTMEQFSNDARYCEWWAKDNSGPANVAGGAVGGAAVGAGLGAVLGAVAGAFLGDPGGGAAIGAALGGVSGGASGMAGAAGSADVRETSAYKNCMAAKGYSVR